MIYVVKRVGRYTSEIRVFLSGVKKNEKNFFIYENSISLVYENSNTLREILKFKGYGI